MSLFRLKGVKNIKETTEWVAGDRDRALYVMTTECDARHASHLEIL